MATPDYLRSHPEVKLTYADLKSSILRTSNITRKQYQHLKSSFLEKITRDAVTWISARGGIVPAVQKVVIYVTRQKESWKEVLVFDHVKYPEVSPQLPSGTIEPGEKPNEAALRELKEESGLNLPSPMSFLGSYTFYKRYNEQFQERFVFKISTESLPETWSHTVTGSGVDNNLEFQYYWLPIPEAIAKLQANLGEALEFFEV